MSGLRQSWLVARRELFERSRSKGLWAGTAIMLLIVVAAIVVPAIIDSGAATSDVGFTLPTGPSWIRRIDTQQYFDTDAYFAGDTEAAKHSDNISLVATDPVPGGTYVVKPRSIVVLEAAP